VIAKASEPWFAKIPTKPNVVLLIPLKIPGVVNSAEVNNRSNGADTGLFGLTLMSRSIAFLQLETVIPSVIALNIK
jgi:hypothetical protein